MELAVAFEFKLDIVVAVDGELGCKFRAFLALESGEGTDAFVREKFLHFPVAEHTACQGVPDLKSAIRILAHVAPWGYFERSAALGAGNRFGLGLALELAAVPSVQIGEKLLYVFHDSVAEFYG